MMDERFVGLDVAKRHLDVAVRPRGQTWQVPNDEVGRAALVQAGHDLPPTLVVLEASGGYERAITAELAAAGVPVVVCNPRQGRDVGRAVGQLAKTDALDAQLLARYAAQVRPPVRPLPDAATQAVVARRRELVRRQAAERQRLGPAMAAVRPRLAAHLAWLAAEIAALEQQRDAAIAASPTWQATADVVRTGPGVGPGLASTLLAELPELGQVGHGEVAVLVGVTPLNRDSGQSRGRRGTWGGRASVRTARSMATVAALRCNPVLHAFRDRLVALGKPRQVVVVACRHTLLTILNAMVRDQRAWGPAP